MRRTALIAGHALVVATLAVGLYLLIVGSGDQAAGPEVSLDAGADGSRASERQPDESPNAGHGSGPASGALQAAAQGGAASGELGATDSGGLEATDVDSGDSGGGVSDGIGPPDAQYSSSVELLAMRLATTEP